MNEEQIKQFLRDNLRVSISLDEDIHGTRGVQVALYFQGDDNVIAYDEKYYKYNCKLTNFSNL